MRKSVADVKAAPVVLIPALEANSCIETILADRSYQGGLGSRLATIYSCVLEIGQRLGNDFVVEPWHWVVKRTFTWLENARLLYRDYEALPKHHESFIYLTMTRLMLRQLTHNRRTR